MPDDGITIQIDGLVELQAKLEELKTTAAESCIRKALRAGALYEKDALETAAPVRPDLPSGTALPPHALENDITISVNKISDDNFIATIGPGRATAQAARLVEYGHRLVTGGRSKTGKSGKSVGPGKQVGTVPAHPWIRPTWESTENEVTRIVTDTLAEEVTKAASKPKNLK
jgi:HK97 gp10 family phage protein